VFGVALHVVSFAARKDRALECFYDIGGFGSVSAPGQPAPTRMYRRPGSRRSREAAGETVLKPQGSSLERTPGLQWSPAVKEE
jgi:hypothetical protein